MSKVTLSNVINLQNENTAVTTINNNNAAITTAIENTLSRDGTSPNQMGSNLDMNSWHILNLPEPSSDTDPIRKIDLTNVSEVTNVLHTASSTSNTIGTGNKTFTVPSGLGFFPGQYLIVQDAASTSNYMIGRVVSYSGTSLVFNSTVTAGSGTISNWVIDISGAPGPAPVLYDTVLNAIGSTIPGSVSFLSLAGYTTVGDGGNGLYKRQVSMPAHMGRFQSADGAWWELVSEEVTPEMFNCKGDALTDDRANMQNCFDFVNSRGGGVVDLTPGKTYRLTVTPATPDLGLILKIGVTLNFNNSQFSFECTGGQCYALRMAGENRLYGPGRVYTTVSSGLSPTPSAEASIWHAPISFGNGYGYGGTIAAPNPYDLVNDVIIDGLTFNSVRNNVQGAMIEGFGGCYDIIIRNCIFPDNATVSIAIGFDWSWLGGFLSSADLNGTKAAYLAGETLSTHPHNILICDNHIGAYTMPRDASPFGSHGIRLSGCYNTEIRNNHIDSTTYAGIFITGGDLSFEFAPQEARLNACRNIVVEGNNINQCEGGYGIFWDAFPDNVYDGVVNPANPSYPYSPIFLHDGYYNNGVIRDNKMLTINFTSVFEGIFASHTKGLTIENNTISGFVTGIRISNGCQDVVIHKNDISLSNLSGILVGDTTQPPQNVSVTKNQVYRNCVGGSAAGGIKVDSAYGTIVDRNILGYTSEDMSSVGINVTVSALRTTITNNYVNAIKTGGTAFVLADATINGLNAVWIFRDNYFSGTGAGNYVSGLSIVPYRRDYNIANAGNLITHCVNPRGTLTADITPTYGVWTVGSTCTNLDATTGQNYTSKCTVAGTPGTWRSTGVVS